MSTSNEPLPPTEPPAPLPLSDAVAIGRTEKSLHDPNKETTTVTINLEKECPRLKKMYDDCFTYWFQKEFTQGRVEPNLTCKSDWDSFRQCMLVSVRTKNLSVQLERRANDAEDESWTITQIN
ncbi:hypothetical protein AKO1_003516 [Acrasis kona]|uniref:Uncharacterized protein n=1 Tax=Acrasis kona TaxID=1008807 RepID=A0AAW2Z6C0_9EUKA